MWPPDHLPLNRGSRVLTPRFCLFPFRLLATARVSCCTDAGKPSFSTCCWLGLGSLTGSSLEWTNVSSSSTRVSSASLVSEWWWLPNLSILRNSTHTKTHISGMCQLAGHSWKILHSVLSCRLIWQSWQSYCNWFDQGNPFLPPTVMFVSLILYQLYSLDFTLYFYHLLVIIWFYSYVLIL